MVDRVVAAPQDPVVAGQPVVVEQVRRVADPLPVRPARPPPSARRSAARSSARSRRPAPSSAAAGAAATGTRWCRARTRSGAHLARRGCARARRPAWSSRPVAGGALVDPHARRRAPPAAAPRPAGPARPSRCRRAPTARRGTSGSRPPRAPASRSSSSYVVAGRPQPARPGRRARRPRAGAVATRELAGLLPAAVDAVPSHRVGDAAQVLRAQPVQLVELVGPALDAVGEAVGQAGRREPAVAAAGLVAAVPGLEQHHVASTGRAPWRAAPPTARCSRRRRRRRSADSGPRSAASAVGSRGVLEPEDRGRRVGQRPGRPAVRAHVRPGVGAGGGRRRAPAAARPGTSPCRSR